MKLTNIILGVTLAVAALLLGRVWWQNHQLDSTNSELNKKLMEANLEIGRANTKFGDANKHIKELESDLQKELKDRNARLTRIGKLEAKLRALRRGSGSSSVDRGDILVIGPDGTSDLDIGMVYQAVKSNQLIPLEGVDAEYSDFRLQILAAIRPEPNEDLELPVYFQYDLNLTLHGQLVESITPSGAVNNYIRLWEVDDKGKKVGDLKLTKFNMIVEDQRKKQFYLWNPRLDVTAFVGSNWPLTLNYGADIGLSLMGYGLTPDDLDWRFLRVGAGLSEKQYLSLTPLVYNFGDLIPVLTNLWIGPGLQYNLSDGGSGLQLILGAML